MSVSKSGNKLTISSTVAISGSVRITAKRNNVPTVSSSAKLIAYGDPNLQDLVTGVENADTVSAYSAGLWIRQRSTGQKNLKIMNGH